jgi:hypothetical protein
MGLAYFHYDVRELYQKKELKIVKYEYIGGCQKWITIQIWLLEILGINPGVPSMGSLFLYFILDSIFQWQTLNFEHPYHLNVLL